MIFIEKFSKGQNSVKKSRWSYVFFFSAHHLSMVYICTNFHENILNGIKVIQRTGFS